MSFCPLHPYLAAQFATGQLAQSFIFSGEQAEAQAIALAVALLCAQPTVTGAACGECASCRNVAAGTHPDCRIFTPAGAQHKVEDMRALVASAGLSPLSGERKVFILRAAENLNAECANTLLKLLEEPPSQLTLILLAADPAALLPTIQSRCQAFQFGGEQRRRVPALTTEIIVQAEELLRLIPQAERYQMLLAARTYDKDSEAQRTFYFALLSVIHRAARGELRLPWDDRGLFAAANRLEDTLQMLDQHANQKLLADVTMLGLWRDCRD